MNRIEQATNRLFSAPYNQVTTRHAPLQSTRFLCLSSRSKQAWDYLAEAFDVLQTVLNFPRPAVSVSSEQGISLWLPLNFDLDTPTACQFLAHFCASFLPSKAQAALTIYPSDNATQPPLCVPPYQNESGQWAAFIEPSMAAMFIEEPWLEVAPNLDSQADLLGRVQLISLELFKKAQHILSEQQALEQPSSSAAQATSKSENGQGTTASAHLQTIADNRNQAKHTAYSDPYDFLLSLMNDQSIAIEQRIAIAQSLLPYRPQSSS